MCTVLLCVSACASGFAPTCLQCIASYTSQMLRIFGERERPNWYFKITHVQIIFMACRAALSLGISAGNRPSRRGKT